jgi:hypothetical protein
MALSTPANTGTSNFWNGSTHKDSSNLLPNCPVLSDTTNAINGSASFLVDNMLYVCSKDSIKKI